MEFKEMMSKKTCPFFNAQCIKDKCIMWNDECAFNTIASNVRTIKDQMDNIKHTEIFDANQEEFEEKKPDYLKNNANETIASELAHYLIENHPELNEFDSPLTRLSSRKFWEDHGVDPNSFDYENQMYDINELAERYFNDLKTPEIIKKGSIEELTSKLFDEVKQIEDLRYLDYGTVWSKLGLNDRYILNPKLLLKIEEVEEQLSKKVRALREERKQKAIENERKEAFNLVPKICTWIKEKGKNHLTKNMLKLFLSEQKVSLKPVNREALYHKVNDELEQIK